jgi:hypothetical protein
MKFAKWVAQPTPLNEIKTALTVEFKKPKSESQCITKLKEIKKRVVEPVWEFDQRFKTLTGHLSFQIPDEQNKEWFIASLLPHIIVLSPLKQITLPWCEVCRNRHRPGEFYYMKKYVQTPTNLYCTFYKYVGHDEKDCRAYDLLHERSRDTYRIQGEMQQEGNAT